MDDPWQRLGKEIDGRRAHRDHAIDRLTNGIARRLKLLSEEGCCSRNAIGWLQHRRNGPVTKIDFKSSADGRDARGRPALLLSRLEHLDDGALMTVSIDVERDSLKSYSISIVGQSRRKPFYARIDLDSEPKGQGLCGHPLLHCHVGADPELNDKFSPRAPLPWLHPADALDWLLTTVHPPLEPCPPPR